MKSLFYPCNVVSSFRMELTSVNSVGQWLPVPGLRTLVGGRIIQRALTIYVTSQKVLLLYLALGSFC
jgi:hypothetical protein